MNVVVDTFNYVSIEQNINSLQWNQFIKSLQNLI